MPRSRPSEALGRQKGHHSFFTGLWDHLFVATGLLVLPGLLIAFVGSLLSRQLDVAGPCAGDGVSFTLLKVGSLAGLFLAAVLAVLGRHEGSDRWFAAAGGLLVAVLWCYGAGLLLNQWLDGAPPTRFENLLVASKEFDDSGETIFRSVTVHAPEALACERTWKIWGVPEDVFESLQPEKTSLTVVVQPGFFGFRWVKGAAIEGAGEPSGRP